jgi:hypothetical protein
VVSISKVKTKCLFAGWFLLLSLAFSTVLARNNKAGEQERTVDRRINLLSMTSTLNSEAQLALVSARSAWCR